MFLKLSVSMCPTESHRHKLVDVCRVVKTLDAAAELYAILTLP